MMNGNRASLRASPAHPICIYTRQYIVYFAKQEKWVDGFSEYIKMIERIDDRKLMMMMIRGTLTDIVNDL